MLPEIALAIACITGFGGSKSPIGNSATTVFNAVTNELSRSLAVFCRARPRILVCHIKNSVFMHKRARIYSSMPQCGRKRAINQTPKRDFRSISLFGAIQTRI